MHDTLSQQLRATGQEHLLRVLEKSAPSDRRQLAAQLAELDLQLLAKLTRSDDGAPDWGDLARRATPPPAFRLHDDRAAEDREEARRRGIQALRAGQVAALLVAGGQGSRLGFEHPKGMFPIGPVSDHSLFQIFSERVLATARRYGRPIPLLIMTSPATHEETVQYLREQHRFGLAEDDLLVFCQGTMPAVDAQTGRLLLASRNSLALAPDGHGGMLAALHKSGVLEFARQRGIRFISYGQIDNPLLQLCQPELMGYHQLAESEMTSQVVEKGTPLDRVGNVVMIDGKMQIIEYSDLPDDVAQQRNADGSLRFWAGSIAVHIFDVDFLHRMAGQADALPFHVARKKVAFVDEEGSAHEPQQPNAIKFERFIFDLLPLARNPVVVEGDPAEVFAPVKNAEGAATDTPTATRQAMIRLHTRWLRRAGVSVADGVAVEISPLWALDEEQVAERGQLPQEIRQPTFLSEI